MQSQSSRGQTSGRPKIMDLLVLSPILIITRLDENCLYLNVFIRGKKIPSKKRSVMVWIHGGGWLADDGDDFFFGPDYFMRKDIVLITFNYRLGVLGFLNLEDEIAPGNQGMKDQLMVLKWVQKNIARFGVHLLALSPAAKAGLFA